MPIIKRYTINGVNLDVDPIEVPDNYYTEAANMVPRVGKMNRAKGYAPIYPGALFGATYLLYTPQLGDPFWLYANNLNVAIINAANQHVDVTPASLTEAVSENGWSGGNLNGLAVINSVRNEPYYWFNGIGTEALPLPGQRTSTRYYVMRPFKYHLIGLGVSDPNGDFRDALHWSDAADPGTIPASWVPTPENEAGDNILADENGAIIDGLALRDAFYIYKQDSVYEMTYTGGTAVMRFRKVFGSTGVLTRNCIVRVKGTHIVLGNGDIYRHDGQNIESIIDGKLRDVFFAAIDDTSFENSFAVYNEPSEEIWFCVPTTGNTRPNLALVYHVTTGEFGYRGIPDADFAASGILAEQQEPDDWDTIGGEWNQNTNLWLNNALNRTEDSILIADAQKQQFYLANEGVSADGEPYRVTVGKLGMALDDPLREKAVRRIWPRINAPDAATFTMELFNQRDPMSALEQVSVQQFQVGKYGVACNVNARYLGIRIFSDDLVDWDISGFDIEYMPRGHF
jgi:hypothetical protein